MGVVATFNGETIAASHDTIAWGYRRPWPLARRLHGRIAFWNGVDVRADS